MSMIEKLHRTRAYPTLRVESDPAGDTHWMYMHNDHTQGARPCFRTELMDDMWSFLNSITLRENLTGYKHPRYVEFRTELPKTNVGKILRRELRDAPAPH